VHLLAALDHHDGAVLAQLASLPWRQIPVMNRTRDHGHGRIEVRTLKVAAVAGLCFPHLAQAIQVSRRVRAGRPPLAHGHRVAVTSLALGSASPTRLAGWLRGHWRIENRLHWVRDVTFGKDAPTAPTGSLPRVMASLRNLAVGALRLAGQAQPRGIAAAYRPRPRPAACHPGPGIPMKRSFVLAALRALHC
jgi:predicted transposase YbfD/YdcC